MKQLIINLVAFLVIGMGGLSLLQTNAQATSTSSAVFAMFAKCEDEHGEMEGDICGRDDNGNCVCADYPEQN